MLNRKAICLRRIIAALVFITCPILLADAKDLPEFQKVPITLNAAEQVPKNILTGPNYRVETEVKK